MKRILSVLTVCLLLASVTGCVALVAGAAGGAGTATWLGGKLTQQVNASFEKTQQATKSALAALKMNVTKETVKDDVAQFVGDYSTGQSFWVDVRPVTSKESRLDVRVGIPGDKEASRKILDKIQAYL